MAKKQMSMEEKSQKARDIYRKEFDGINRAKAIKKVAKKMGVTVPTARNYLSKVGSVKINTGYSLKLKNYLNEPKDLPTLRLAKSILKSLESGGPTNTLNDMLFEGEQKGLEFFASGVNTAGDWVVSIVNNNVDGEKLTDVLFEITGEQNVIFINRNGYYEIEHPSGGQNKLYYVTGVSFHSFLISTSNNMYTWIETDELEENFDTNDAPDGFVQIEEQIDRIDVYRLVDGIPSKYNTTDYSENIIFDKNESYYLIYQRHLINVKSKKATRIRKQMEDRFDTGNYGEKRFEGTLVEMNTEALDAYRSAKKVSSIDDISYYIYH